MAPATSVARCADFAPVAAAPANELAGLDGLPALGSIGELADRVTDGPSAAHALLSTGTGRSLTVILALLAAITVFLAIHRRTDRGDRKLAADANGPERRPLPMTATRNAAGSPVSDRLLVLQFMRLLNLVALLVVPALAGVETRRAVGVAWCTSSSWRDWRRCGVWPRRTRWRSCRGAC